VKETRTIVDEIENVKNKALKTPLQGIVASLEGMKIRNDREVCTAFPKLLILGEKDPVLPHEETKLGRIPKYS
jgi:hypothetical protein